MPVTDWLPELPLRPTTSALIVGNGPSRSLVRWPHVFDRLARELPAGPLAPKLVLINEEPLLGARAPDYAISIAKGVSARLLARKDAPGFNRMVVLSGRDAPKGWPRMSAGSLAVWAMTRLGYGTIYLYGLDGSAAEDGHGGGRMRRWEQTIRQHHRARSDGKASRLVRIWPRAVRWVDREPLGGAVSDTMLIGRQ